MPELSVIIPTYNRAKLLRRSLESLFKCIDAEFPETEVIVVDDGSTDATGRLLAEYAGRIDHRIFQAHGGTPVAFNRGLAEASAPVVRLFGDDDEILPGGIAPMMECLRAHPDFDIVSGYNDVWFEEPDGSRTKVEQAKYIGEISWNDLLQYGEPRFIIPETCFVRKRLFDRIGGYEPTLLLAYLDHFFRALSKGARIFVEPIVIQNTYQDRERAATCYPLYAADCKAIKAKWMN